MSVKAEVPEVEWAEMSVGEYEWQSEHAYYRIHHNLVTNKWHLGRRLHPDTPIQVVGIYAQMGEAQAAAEFRAASL